MAVRIYSETKLALFAEQLRLYQKTGHKPSTPELLREMWRTYAKLNGLPDQNGSAQVTA